MAATSLGCNEPGAACAPHDGPQLPDRRDLGGAIEQRHQRGGGLVRGKSFGGRFAVARSSCWG
jgi:hypothetical protein